ncbi:MAG: RloB family protein [Micrococcales bacterium]|nr:RloB family protein [Micrococcales bacterium]MCL2667760.1 RloB family protein [Micrococcales bacterium]
MVTEGVKSEPQYVDGAKQLFRDSHVEVKTHGVGRDPASVLAKAELLLRQAKNSGEPYDWCCVVVDVDDHATLDRCLADARKAGVHVVVSNPCFEIWLLWHHADHHAHIDRRALRDVIRRYGITDKTLPLGFRFAAYPDATNRARQADPNLASGRTGPNPSSAMPVLLNLMSGEAR